MEHHDPVFLTTVSSAFIQDWLLALETRCQSGALPKLLRRAGIETDLLEQKFEREHRITFNEIAQLYQMAVAETKDEMMGLWGRPVRPRTLQYLVTVMRDASTPVSALYRFSTFWNMLLDDFRLELRNRSHLVELVLVPYEPDIQAQRFGHMLLLKLAHGLLSWLVGMETPVKEVRLAFPRPEFAPDYAVVFPCKVQFKAAHTAIAFDPDEFSGLVKRSGSEALVFLQRAPLDWIFTGSRTHTYSLQVRSFLFGTNWKTCQLREAADALNVTPRTLIRRLKAEGTSFQEIKDALRRDIAIRALQHGTTSIEDISHETGFSAPSNFHRAFRKWTGRTPAGYRSLMTHPSS